VIRATVEDKFEGGVNSYGFAEGGLTLAPVRPSVFKVVTPAIQNIMQEIQAQVITGQIQVDLEKEA
jgi:basic membrane lipoprotein Med (substrate-binding protein (PBP1-ABC) superfamily)